MPHKSIRAGVDDPVVRLRGDRARPEPAEIKARPPGDGDAGRDQDDACPGKRQRRQPEAQPARIAMGGNEKQGGARGKHGARGSFLAKAGAPDRTVRPEGGERPGDHPGEPESGDGGTYGHGMYDPGVPACNASADTIKVRLRR